MKKEITYYKADFALLVIAIAWGSGYSVTKVAIELVSPIQFLTYRYVISALLSLVLFHKKLKLARERDIAVGSIMGILLMVSMLIQTIGLKYTGAGRAIFIANSFVIMVPFFFWIISKEKPTAKILIASLIMLVGLAFLSADADGASGIIKGDAIILLSAVFFAMHTAVIGKFSPQRDPFLLASIQFIVAAILFLMIYPFCGGAVKIESHFVLPILYSGIVITFACTLVQVVAQKYTNPSRAAIIISLESVFGIIIARFFLNELYKSITNLAYVIIFLAVLVAELNIKPFKLVLRRK